MVFSIAILTTVSVFGHDPLADDQEGRRSIEHHDNSQIRPDLSEVRALVVSFREAGDDRYLDDAWALLSPALAATPDADTLIAASFVAQSRHEFEYAVQLITQALAINGNNDEAWLLLASIRLVLGEAESAALACRQLRDAPPVVVLTCKARIALALGEHHVAFQRMYRILQVAESRQLPSDLLAWSYSVAADLAVADAQLDQAQTLYRISLRLTERSQVRAALIDVLMMQAQYRSAWQALEEGSLALPLLVRRLIVAQRLGRADELKPMLVKVRQEFAEWIANEDWLHAREMTRFYIDVDHQPELARRLALINISLQREPEDQRLEKRTRPPSDLPDISCECCYSINT